jgi:hypothetical protein
MAFLVGALAGIVLSVVLAAAVWFVATATGRMTIDTGWGRRTRRLGPQVVRLGAPRERAFELLGVPYLSERPPRALREKVDVIERADGMVLAAHRTKAGPFTAVTVETVTFEPPERIGFRLVRGPVPYVREVFELREIDGGTATELEYTGELATDGWALGAGWGRLVARLWERTVAESLSGLQTTIEGTARHLDDS